MKSSEKEEKFERGLRHFNAREFFEAHEVWEGLWHAYGRRGVLADVVKACDPIWAVVKGVFRPRGGISTTVEARWPRPVI